MKIAFEFNQLKNQFSNKKTHIFIFQVRSELTELISDSDGWRALIFLFIRNGEKENEEMEKNLRIFPIIDVVGSWALATSIRIEMSNWVVKHRKWANAL